RRRWGRSRGGSRSGAAADLLQNRGPGDLALGGGHLEHLRPLLLGQHPPGLALGGAEAPEILLHRRGPALIGGLAIGRPAIDLALLLGSEGRGGPRRRVGRRRGWRR